MERRWGRRPGRGRDWIPFGTITGTTMMSPRTFRCSLGEFAGLGSTGGRAERRVEEMDEDEVVAWWRRVLESAWSRRGSCEGGRLEEFELRGEPLGWVEWCAG